MRIIWLGICASVFLLSAPVLRAQSAAIPDTPTAPASKLNLTLPEPTYQPPSTHTEDRPLVCEAPPSGVYTLEDQKIPHELTGAARFYNNKVASEVFSDWQKRFARTRQLAWEKHRLVMVRVAIRPDGTIFEPEITKSSGSASDDLIAIGAVRAKAPYDPLPAGITHPIIVCMRFGYRTYEDEMSRSSDTDFVKEKKDPSQEKKDPSQVR